MGEEGRRQAAVPDQSGSGGGVAVLTSVARFGSQAVRIAGVEPGHHPLRSGRGGRSLRSASAAGSYDRVSDPDEEGSRSRAVAREPWQRAHPRRPASLRQRMVHHHLRARERESERERETREEGETGTASLLGRAAR